jgi:hypothetical protein
VDVYNFRRAPVYPAKPSQSLPEVRSFRT